MKVIIDKSLCNQEFESWNVQSSKYIVLEKCKYSGDIDHVCKWGFHIKWQWLFIEQCHILLNILDMCVWELKFVASPGGFGYWNGASSGWARVL